MATTYNQQQASTTNNTLVGSITNGVIAGLIGGSVFGVMMATMQMLPMVAGLVGSESILVGFIVHMLISAVIGASYGVIGPRLPAGWPVAIGVGTVFGIIWWVLGALILMPLILGMGEMVLVIGDMQWMSFVGHVTFGIITAAFYRIVAR